MAKIETSDFDGNSALEADVRSMFADIERIRNGLNRAIQRLRNNRLVTDVTLSIGSNVKRVAYTSFTFVVRNKAVEKAAGTVGKALNGSSVPQDKWGAWSFDIGSAGSITVTEAPDNSTGYDDRRLAAVALANPDNTEARMGYVLIRRNAGGAFVPDTTSLALPSIDIVFNVAVSGLAQPNYVELETWD